jgi:hypothetical protein
VTVVESQGGMAERVLPLEVTTGCQAARIDAITLPPRLADFNEDPRGLGRDVLRAASGADST